MLTITFIACNRKLANHSPTNVNWLTWLSPLDTLAAFDTASQDGLSATTPARYAVRQALDQEYQKYMLRQSADLRQARYRAGGGPDEDSEPITNPNPASSVPDEASKPMAAKRDFFGRIVGSSSDGAAAGVVRPRGPHSRKEREIWVSFHEGFSNAVRKPISLDELIKGF